MTTAAEPYLDDDALPIVSESPQVIVGASGPLIGVATRVVSVADVAVLIVPAPGGSRTGAHRLHVRLARELARRGIPSMRFDAADGGDSVAGAGSSAFHDDDVVAAARHLLTLQPDAFVALLAAGDAAVSAARSWNALIRAAVPLSALCLVDPVMAIPAPARRQGWFRRIFGGTPPGAEEAGSPPPHGESAETAATLRVWRGLPAAVRTGRSRLLVAARGDDRSNAALVGLARGTRAWRRALRRSDGWLQIGEADPGFGLSAHRRVLADWLAARLIA
ncbi:MAG: hypothetical protein KF755_13865 [Burkholderiaceae bacterium]|nr:hypothetical protein [Burkholderiaceae bacterium]